MIRNTRQSWGWPARALHWIVAAMVLGLFVHGLAMDELPDEGFQRWLHAAIGITLLVLAAVGFVWWRMNVVPNDPAATPRWQQRGTRLAHWALYGLIFAVTIVGWVLASSLREPVSIDLLGLITVPRLTGLGAGAHELVEEAHEVLAYTLIALVAVHVAAALYHHFVLRDGVLLRMLGRKPTGSA